MASTVTEVVTRVLSTTAAAAASPSSTARASPQGGILEGANPSHYDPKNPIVIFIIQAGIIIVFCRLLHWPLSKIRQPRVIAEVIGGILLGPSVMGRIPGFTNAIFPAASIPNLTLVANLGLVLFLFLVGLEVDLRYFLNNWRIALSVGAAGMALPFALGCAIAWGLFNTFHDEPGTVPIDFPVYMLFIGVAMAITAFPVLCRILTELKLLSTPVGVIVLSAGVGNDVIGWILLALCVALTNAGDGLTALWVLLSCVGFTLFLVFAVRPAFMWVLRRTRSLQDGPSQGVIALALMIALASAFFTAIIGVHPIFGAFLAGLICPHEGGFAIRVTEKVEDLISTIFLPLYFALSGLSTDLGLLDNGITWAYVVGVVATAFFGKLIGGSGAARLNGLVWRECFTIGALMSCKGLVELIVLNIGLQAKILSVRTFTIFVVMALITTFATTPLVSALYPPWYRQKLEAWRRGDIDWHTGQRRHSAIDDKAASVASVSMKHDSFRVRRILLHLRLDGMPGLLALVSLCGGSNHAQHQQHSNDAKTGTARDFQPISVHGLRLLQLTERESSVMQVSEVDEYSALDPVVNTFRAFGQLHHIAVSGEVVIALEAYFAEMLTMRARETSSDLLLLPWSETGGMSESTIVSSTDAHCKLASPDYRGFVSDTLGNATEHVGVFVDNGFGSLPAEPRRRLTRRVSEFSVQREPATAATAFVPRQERWLVVPFCGTPDDELAVRFALQLVHDESVHVRIGCTRSADSAAGGSWPPASQATTHSAPKDKAHSVRVHNQEVPSIAQQAAQLETLRGALPSNVAARVQITAIDSGLTQLTTGEATMELLKDGVWQNGGMLVLGRNAAATSEPSVLGATADYVAEQQPRCSLLVMQSAQRGPEVMSNDGEVATVTYR